MPVLVPGPRVVSRSIEGRALLLDAAHDRLERLNEVGSFIWARIQERRHDLESLRAAVMAEFEVAPEVADADLAEFVDELVARGMARFEG